jgi:transketolase
MKLGLKELKLKASKIRLRVLEDAVRAGKGHLGGCFSCVELLVSLYYGGFLKIDPHNSKDLSRDFFILSKGHACLSLYPILNDLGFLSNERHQEYGKNGSSVGGQLDISIPGSEYNTGSLGHALGICAGFAFGSKVEGRKNKSVVLIGDAECDEGAIWEAIFFAAEHKLDNLVCIVDRNRLSVMQTLESEVVFGSFEEKMNLFEWDCIEIDGHSYQEIFSAFKAFDSSTRPLMILANTIKGKGVSFMESITKWHHSVPTETEVELARKELKI